MISRIVLKNEDCLVAMDRMIEKGIKVDAIICDPPYGTTRNKWDSVIPLDAMWERLNKLIKDNGAVVLFSDGLFTSKLKLSNEKMWRYDRIWDKQLLSGHLNANRMPMKQTETISVFYKKLPTYNPQKTDGGRKINSKGNKKETKNRNYGYHEVVDNRDKLGTMKHPTSLISIMKPHPSKAVHPTQKPTELMEELIKTYTNENELVLDFTMGSGTTGVACKNTNRNFIGVELDEEYFNVAKDRINDNKH